MWERHQSLRNFLVNDLGVDFETADEEACLMEHAISQDTMKKWVDFLERLHRDEADGDDRASSLTVWADLSAGSGHGDAVSWAGRRNLRETRYQPHKRSEARWGAGPLTRRDVTHQFCVNPQARGTCVAS